MAAGPRVRAGPVVRSSSGPAGVECVAVVGEALAMGLMRRLFEHRRLLIELVRRDIRGRFAGARLGLAWSLLNPVIQLGSYSIIFGVLYPAVHPLGSRGFIAALFCGLWPWWAFSDGLQRGMTALVDQAGLLRRLPIPADVCVVASTLVAFGLQMAGFALFLLLFGGIGVVPPRPGWLLLPLLALLTFGLTAALGLLLAPFQLAIRDTAHVVSAALTLGFFVSPVLYEVDRVPEVARPLIELNPMTGLIGAFRTLVLGAAWPPLSSLVALAVVLLVLPVVAAWLFRRIEGRLDEYA